MKKILFILSLVVVSITAFSQSLLWKISGKDLKEPSYFYGTIHIQDERVFAFDSIVMRAMNACDAFAAELILDQIDASAVRSSMCMPKGKVLSNMLSKEDYALLDSLCKAKLGISVLFCNTMKPLFLYSSLQQVDFAKNKENSFLDLYLMENARANGKECFGLEEYSDQIKAIDEIKLKDQIEMLTQFVHNPDSDITMMDSLLLLYLAFDLESLQSMTEEGSQKFQSAIVNKRNIKMAEHFLTIARKRSLFAAVGAGHLGGKKGVLALLKKRGYIVEPIVFQWVSK